jgi:hypothetical protein
MATGLVNKEKQRKISTMICINPIWYIPVCCWRCIRFSHPSHVLSARWNNNYLTPREKPYIRGYEPAVFHKLPTYPRQVESFSRKRFPLFFFYSWRILLRTGYNRVTNRRRSLLEKLKCNLLRSLARENCPAGPILPTGQLRLFTTTFKQCSWKYLHVWFCLMKLRKRKVIRSGIGRNQDAVGISILPVYFQALSLSLREICMKLASCTN